MYHSAGYNIFWHKLLQTLGRKRSNRSPYCAKDQTQTHAHMQKLACMHACMYTQAHIYTQKHKDTHPYCTCTGQTNSFQTKDFICRILAATCILKLSQVDIEIPRSRRKCDTSWNRVQSESTMQIQISRNKQKIQKPASHCTAF